MFIYEAHSLIIEKEYQVADTGVIIHYYINYNKLL